MNAPLITNILGFAGLILAVFDADWLNQQAINKRIDDLKLYLDARFSAVDAKFEAVAAEFKSVRAEIQSVRTKIQSVRAEVINLGMRVDRIERQLDQVFKPSLPRA